MVDTSNKIQCEICKLWYKQITSTHLKFHEITLSEYKKLYPNSPIVSSEVSQKLISVNKNKWSNSEYKEKVANTISEVIKDQWINGKYHRIQSEDHKTKRAESRKKTYKIDPKRFMGINHNPEIDQFVKDHTGKYFCECGCGEEIIIERYHYSVGIPKFKYNHHGRDKNYTTFGTHLSLERRIILSCAKQGISRSNWNGFARNQPYCDKWTEDLREEIRNKYNNCDYISGLPNYICNVMNDKVWNLDVHHIDFDKDQGCNDKKFKLIPLSKSNHMKTNKNRPFWNRLFKYSLEYDKKYYSDNKVNIWEMI